MMGVLMTPEQIERIREVFDRVYASAEEERANELEQLRRTDAQIAEGVQRLLRTVDQEALGQIVSFEETAFLDGVTDEDGAPLSRFSVGDRIVTVEGPAQIAEVLSDPRRFGDTEVYRGSGLAGRSDAAMKVLVGTHASAERLRRFRLEAQVQAACRHEHIARLFSAGPLVDGSGASFPSILMEFVDGEPLDTFARQVNHHTACQTLAVAADAVHFANLRGVVHRDLKPSNIIVRSDGTPKVLDFGVAKLVEANAAQESVSLATQGVAIVGTLAYMAPEQISPVASEIDLRTDVYALGVILHEILCGRRPFDTDSGSISSIWRAKSGGVPLSQPPPGIPRELFEVASIACSGNPRDRHESCGEFAAELRRALLRRPLRRRPPGVRRRAILFVVRRPVAGVAIAVASISLLAAIAMGIVQQHRVSDERDLAEARFATAQDFARWVIFDLSNEIDGDPKYREFQRKLIERASGTLLDLEVGEQSRAELRLDAATAHIQLAELFLSNDGDYVAVRSEIHRARALLDSLDSPEAAAMRAWCWFKLAYANGRPDGETTASMNLEALRDLEGLEGALSNNASYWRWRAWVSCYASRRYIDEQRPADEVRDLLADAARSARLAYEANPEDRGNQLVLAECAFWIAYAEFDFRSPRMLDATGESIDAAIVLARSSHPKAVSMIVRTRSLHARALGVSGRPDQALEVIAETLEVAEASVARDPDSKEVFRQVEVLHNWAAEICSHAINAGRPDLVESGLWHARSCLQVHRERLRQGWVDPEGEGHYLAEFEARVQALENAQHERP